MTKDVSGAFIPPPLIYIAGFLMGVALDKIYPLPLPDALFYPGIVMVAVSFIFAVVTIREFTMAKTTFKVNETATRLITTGPFSVSRNPLFLGSIIAYIGVAMLMRTFFPILLLPLTVLVVIKGVIEREEDYLEAKFGDNYHSYKRRTRRWL